MAPKKQPHNLSAGPLICWDIFMEGYYRRLELGDDLTSLKKLAKKMEWQAKVDFEDALFKQGNTIIVTDSFQKIIYASSAIVNMNGYKPQEVVGFRPSMFQGANTTEASKILVREAIIKQMPFDQVLINYKKSGEPYNCHIKGFAMFNDAHKLVNYIAFEKLA